MIGVDQPDAVRAAALAALDAGLCPIRPETDGTKRPKPVPHHGKLDPATNKRGHGWEAYQLEPPPRPVVEGWFRGHPGLGLVCGAVSGHLQMLELEGRMMSDEARRRRLLDALDRHGARETWNRMTAGYRESTPSGGMHTMARVPGHIAGNVTLARCITEGGPRPLIETRGDGGFVVVAPSNGPTHPSGGTWTLEAGGFASIATVTVEEWAALLAAATDCNEVVSPEAIVPAANRLTVPQPWDGGVVGDSWMDVTAAHLEATEGVLGILLRHGWTHWRDTPEMVYVTRPVAPGEDKQGGVSAQIKRSNGRMINYSSSVTEFETWPTFRGDPPRQEPTRSYDAADVLAVYEFDGDRTAALRAVAEQTGIYDAWLAERDPLAGITINASAAAEPATVAPRNLPDEFWERPDLAKIRRYAHGKGRSADAVYGAVRARVCALTPHDLSIDTGIAVPVSLNSLVAIIAMSGGGKTTSASLARHAVPIDIPEVYEGPLGSGEGVVELYYEWQEQPNPNGGKPKKVKVQTKRRALLRLDEGEALARMADRSGATILPTLRSAYSGEMIGQTNARTENRRVLAAGSYRLVLLVGLQDLAAAKLLADSATGTPQRFIMFNATDPTIPDATHEVPPPWGLTGPWVPPPGQTMAVVPEVRAEIRERDLAVQRGTLVLDPLDAHRNQNRIKEAAMLAILEGRQNITTDDWRLAGMVLDTSDSVRQWIIARAGTADGKVEDERTRAAVRRKLATVQAVDADAHMRAVRAGARAMARRAALLDPDAVAMRDLSRAVAGRDRQLAGVDEMRELALSMDWLRPAGDGSWSVGGSRPT